jgi:hypothetical protein
VPRDNPPVSTAVSTPQPSISSSTCSGDSGATSAPKYSPLMPLATSGVSRFTQRSTTPATCYPSRSITVALA